jgi:hypothetical protein
LLRLSQQTFVGWATRLPMPTLFAQRLLARFPSGTRKRSLRAGEPEVALWAVLGVVFDGVPYKVTVPSDMPDVHAPQRPRRLAEKTRCRAFAVQRSSLPDSGLRLLRRCAPRNDRVRHLLFRVFEDAFPPQVLWIPAFAGMTKSLRGAVGPPKTYLQASSSSKWNCLSYDDPAYSDAVRRLGRSWKWEIGGLKCEV